MAPPFGARALGGGADVVGHGRHAGARLLQRFQRLARVLGQWRQRGQCEGPAGFARVASSRWVSALTLPAAWPMLPSALGDALLVLIAQQLVDAAGGFFHLGQDVEGLARQCGQRARV